MTTAPHEAPRAGRTLRRAAGIGAVIGLAACTPILATAIAPQMLAALRPGGLIGPHLLTPTGPLTSLRPVGALTGLRPLGVLNGLRSGGGAFTGGAFTGARSGAAMLSGLKPVSMPISVGPADRARLVLLRAAFRRRLSSLRKGR